MVGVIEAAAGEIFLPEVEVLVDSEVEVLVVVVPVETGNSL